MSHDKVSSLSGMLMTEGGKDIMFGDYGPVWKFHRKVAYSAMK